jgi:hypothetical protein
MNRYREPLRSSKAEGFAGHLDFATEVLAGSYANEPPHKSGEAYFSCFLASAFSASAIAFLNAATAGTL